VEVQCTVLILCSAMVRYYCTCCDKSFTAKSSLFTYSGDVVIERSVAAEERSLHSTSKKPENGEELLCGSCRKRNYAELARLRAAQLNIRAVAPHEDVGEVPDAPSQAGASPSASKSPYPRRSVKELIDVITKKDAILSSTKSELKNVLAELKELKAKVGKEKLSMLTRIGQHPLLEALCSCLDKGLLTSANSPR